jgi:hypothetical protein
MSQKRRAKRGSAPARRTAPARRAATAGDERGPRRALGLGAAAALAGLALAGTGESDLGMVLTLAGAFAMIYAIHTYGRLGPAAT